MSEFEQKLKELFPDIYQMHELAKDVDNGGGGETHMWDLLMQLLEMNQQQATGTIQINYSKGRIDAISVRKDVLAFRKREGTIDKR